MTMIAFFAAVIVVDVDRPENGLACAQRKRDDVTGPHVMLVGEWLADDDVVAAAQLRVDHARGAAGEKLRFSPSREQPIVSAEPSVAGKPW